VHLAHTVREIAYTSIHQLQVASSKKSCTTENTHKQQVERNEYIHRLYL